MRHTAALANCTLQFYTADSVFRKDPVSTYPEGEAASDTGIPREPQCSFWGWVGRQSPSGLRAPHCSREAPRRPARPPFSAYTSTSKAPGEATRCQVASKKLWFNEIVRAGPWSFSLKEGTNQV